MRSQTPMIYDEHGDSYRADTCRPLVLAIEQHQVLFRAFARGQYPGQPIPRGLLAGVKTIGFWHARNDQEWGLDWHRNEGIEICFLETGHLSFGVDHQNHQLTPNTLTVTRPWQLHRLGSPCVTVGRLHWLILDVGVRRPNQPWRWPNWLVLAPHDIQQLGDCLRQNERPVWQLPSLRDCFRGIASAVADNEPISVASQLAVLLNELFLRLLEIMRKNHPPQTPTFSESHRTVELFLRELAISPSAIRREWTVRSMAATCGLGSTQLIKYCQQLTNTTPARYLNQCRIDAAARQLRSDPTRTVMQVALDCGFSSSQYFATAFHTHFGCSPSEYRNKHNRSEFG